MKTRSQVKRKAPPPESDERVLVVPVEARRLVVLGEDLFVLPPVADEFQGAIVWFKVPPLAQPHEVRARQAALLRAGAVRARPWEFANEDAPVPEAAHDAPSAAVGIRPIVAELVEALPAALREPAGEIVERALSKVGL